LPIKKGETYNHFHIDHLTMLKKASVGSFKNWFKFFWGASSPLFWFNNKEFLCITQYSRTQLYFT